MIVFYTSVYFFYLLCYLNLNSNMYLSSTLVLNCQKECPAIEFCFLWDFFNKGHNSWVSVGDKALLLNLAHCPPTTGIHNVKFNANYRFDCYLLTRSFKSLASFCKTSTFILKSSLPEIQIILSNKQEFYLFYLN